MLYGTVLHCLMDVPTQPLLDPFRPGHQMYVRRGIGPTRTLYVFTKEIGPAQTFVQTVGTDTVYHSYEQLN